MKNRTLVLSQCMLVLMCSWLASCQAIEGVFKAGVWAGVLLVVGIIAVIIFIIAKVAGRK